MASKDRGKWQALLLAAVGDVTTQQPACVDTLEWLRDHLGREPTPAEKSAVYRAARTLIERGLVAHRPCRRTWLEPLPEPV